MLGQFVITLREGFEAGLIIGIMIAYLIRTNRNNLVKYVFSGSYLAIILGIIIGAFVFLIYGALSRSFQLLFEALAAYLAVAVLTTVILWMITKGKTIKKEIESKIEISITKGTMFALASFAFVVVFREALETVLFLTPFILIAFQDTIIGTILGILFALFLSYGIFKLGMKINIRRFFYFTSIIIILLAGGLAGYGTHELIEYLEDSNVQLGFWAEKAYDLKISKDDLLHHKNVIGSIFAVMFGYSVSMEWLRLIVHLTYLSIFIPVTIVVYRRA
ncbi:MAG: FTR1 family iron permease [Thermoproteota archaeon]|jgi:high-affinity iron transporter